MARYPIDPAKLLVLGFSQGGVMAYSLALSNPHRFVACVALSTWLPPELQADIGDLTSCHNLPTLIQHGSRDELVNVERARTSVEVLREARVPLTYREYDIGHEISAQSLRDLSSWLQNNALSPIVTG